MSIYRNNIWIQIITFIAFLLLGINVFLSYLLAEAAPWYSFILLGLIVVLIVIAIIIYKKSDRSVIEISMKEYKDIRTTLYVYFIIYILNIVLKSGLWISPFVLALISSILLSFIAIFGILLHMKILTSG